MILSEVCYDLPNNRPKGSTFLFRIIPCLKSSCSTAYWFCSALFVGHEAVNLQVTSLYFLSHVFLRHYQLCFGLISPDGISQDARHEYFIRFRNCFASLFSGKMC